MITKKCIISNLVIKYFPDMVERMLAKLSVDITNVNHTFIDNELTVTGYPK